MPQATAGPRPAGQARLWPGGQARPARRGGRGRRRGGVLHKMFIIIIIIVIICVISSTSTSTSTSITSITSTTIVIVSIITIELS